MFTNRYRKLFRLWILALAPLASMGFGAGILADSGDVTDDFQPFFMCSMGVTCPGSTMGVWADVDGVDNGTVYDPYETMVTFYTATGSACGETFASGDKVYSHSPSTSECAGGAENRGRFVIDFVDMTVPGFDQTDWTTWTFKTVPSLSFWMGNSGESDAADPYQQAKAYRIASGIYGDSTATPVPANLIDGDSSCSNMTIADGITCEFSDPDDGIAEIWVTTDFGESHLTTFIIHSPTQPGVVLLFDGSGSMSWSHDGDHSVPVDEQRLSLAKRAAIPFMDELLDHGKGEAEFGIARFPRHPYDGCNAETLTGMTPIDAASHDAATSVTGTIQSLAAGGSTPMIAGLEQAASLLASHDPKTIVLLSDGYHNCPSTIEAGDPAYTDLLGSLGGVGVYTIGFSLPGDLDGHFLDELAVDTTGDSLHFHDVTGPFGFDPGAWDPATALAATYNKILANGLGLELVADPSGLIGAGETRTHQIAINERDRKVSFFLSWAKPQEDRVQMLVKASDGVNVEETTAGVRVHQGPAYKIVTVDRTFLEMSDKVGPAPWTLEVEGSGIDAGESEHYQYSVIADSALKMRVWLDKPRYRTGDLITLSARVLEATAPVKTLELAQVRVSRPGDGLGNWFAANKLREGELAKIPADRSGENLPPIQRKAMFLREFRQIAAPGRKAPVTQPLFDDGSHGDTQAGDGIYTTQFADTAKEGTYAFLVRTGGKTQAGTPFERERLVQKYLVVQVSSEHVLTSVESLGETADKIKRFAVTVTPKDASGNFLGPNHRSRISLTASKGQFTDGLRDNLDGTYTQTLTMPVTVDQNEVDVSVAIGDVGVSFNLGEKLAPSIPGWLIGLVILLALLVILVIWFRRSP